MTSENEFVALLQKRFPAGFPVETGIGDDGAVIRTAGDAPYVVVTDMLLDGVHFDVRRTSPDLIGRKSIAVNLSDLAAMGCTPVAAFVSVAFPHDLLQRRPNFGHEFFTGVEDVVRKYHFCLAGGDTNSWNGPFAVNVCMTGTPIRSGTASGRMIPPVLRSGAQPGDILFVTGALGGSLKSGRHLTFLPRFDAIQWLVDHVAVHAVMDISDGLSTDLHRMMAASGRSAVLQADRIPIHDDVSPGSDEERLKAALNDGEDFELLISVAADEASILRRDSKTQSLCFHEIGVVTEGSGVLLQRGSGIITSLLPAGWQHEF